MCDPVTAIVGVGAALKIGSTIAESKAQNKQADATKDAALESMRIQDHELSLEEVQNRIAAGQTLEQGSQQVAAATGDVNSSAAARGVSGMTVDLLLADVARQGQAYKEGVGQQLDANLAQTEAEKEAVRAQAAGRIAGAPRANPFATGLKIAGAFTDFAAWKIGQKPKGM